MTTEHTDILGIVAKNPGITSAEIAEKMHLLGYYHNIDRPSNHVAKQLSYLKKVAKVTAETVSSPHGHVNQWTLAPEYNPEPVAVIEPNTDTEPTAYYSPAALAELVESADDYDVVTEDDEMASDVQESIILAPFSYQNPMGYQNPIGKFLDHTAHGMDAVMTPDYTANDIREALKNPFQKSVSEDTVGLWADCVHAVAYADGLHPAISKALLDCADWLEGLTG